MLLRWRRLSGIGIVYDSPPAPCHNPGATGLQEPQASLGGRPEQSAPTGVQRGLAAARVPTHHVLGMGPRDPS